MEELSSGQELWLQEVESVDYWGPTFRAIYESECQDDFLKRLERRIEEHDSEIEKMCNHHYQVSTTASSSQAKISQFFSITDVLTGLY